jgi:hypothetical protein
MDRQDEHSDGRHRKAEEAVGAAALATPHLTPQALAVQLICHCEEVADEGVEVLVLRGLLTATTSISFTLHGQALLLAVRTCYNIHLMTRSEVNQTTAKATLTQMLNVVFQRMEAGSVKIVVRGCCSKQAQMASCSSSEVPAGTCISLALYCNDKRHGLLGNRMSSSLLLAA